MEENYWGSAFESATQIHGILLAYLQTYVTRQTFISLLAMENDRNSGLFDLF